MPSPSVSLCLLTYSRARVIGRSIASLLRQTFVDFELVICDNASPDHTEAVVSRYAKADSRIRYHRNTRNVGMTGNYNCALRMACAPYIAFVHDGDVYAPTLIARWKTALDEHPTAAFAFCALDVINDHGEILYSHRHDFPEFVPGRQLLALMLSRPTSPVWGIVMVRKEAIQSVGVFDERFPWAGDVDMWMRLLQKHDAVYVRDPLIQISQRENSHPLNAPNWEHIRAVERLYAVNLLRAFRESNRAVVLRLAPVLSYRLLLQRVRYIGWYAKRGRLRDAISGLRP